MEISMRSARRSKKRGDYFDMYERAGSLRLKATQDNDAEFLAKLGSALMLGGVVKVYMHGKRKPEIVWLTPGLALTRKWKKAGVP